MAIEQAAASYRRDLGDGLVLRWSKPDDAERLAQLMGTVWRASADAPPNPRLMEVVRRHMRGEYPLVGPGDCALVEDTQQPSRSIVACAFLWREEWSYEDIPFGVGRPENIATDPAYRNRGLVRAIMELVHARSAAEGHLVQAITGIPHFYRQFGYEYALDLHGRRVIFLALIPEADAGSPEPYALREAALADIPAIMEIYDRRRAGSLVWNRVSERYWRYQIEKWHNPALASLDPTLHGVNDRIQVIVDAAGAVHGYAIVATKRWASDLQVYALELAGGVNWQLAMPALLRALRSYGLGLPCVRPKIEPLREISLLLGREHPAYAALGQALASLYEPPYAWYIRVPDLTAFLQLIAPALERRLAESPAASYSGELTLNFYRYGLRLIFDAGRLASIAPWSAPAYNTNADAGFPALVFLQLLFGYRSLAELRYAFPDVVVGGAAEPLLNALFPARPSWLMAL
ncbi:MAG TPA: GNAT family N-acetyltransferase [Roseiflexaceae bacterium]|nr:GNAT family N-acetyltransferase [Roseiflexaceae bacterium]